MSSLMLNKINVQVTKSKPGDWTSGLPVDEHGRLQVTIRKHVLFLMHILNMKQNIYQAHAHISDYKE
jgi:hypothetical protein